ncbi:hypothetical protein C7G83_20545, partial [Siccibacter turicensis]
MTDEKCVRCGGDQLVEGAVVWNAPLRFKREGAGHFNRGTQVNAVACETCGHIDL